MWTAIGRYIALLLAALGMSLGAAHVLEWAPRSEYDSELYTRVTSTQYRYFGLIGGPIQVAALISAIIMSWAQRRQTGRRLWWVGTAFLSLSLALWGILVQPVNAAWAQAWQADPPGVTEKYEELRIRWEFGHMAAFAAWFVGFCLLLVAAQWCVGEKEQRRTHQPEA